MPNKNTLKKTNARGRKAGPHGKLVNIGPVFVRQEIAEFMDSIQSHNSKTKSQMAAAALEMWFREYSPVVLK